MCKVGKQKNEKDVREQNKMKGRQVINNTFLENEVDLFQEEANVMAACRGGHDAYFNLRK